MNAWVVSICSKKIFLDTFIGGSLFNFFSQNSDNPGQNKWQ